MDGPGSPVAWAAALVLLGVAAACLPAAPSSRPAPYSIALLAFAGLIVLNNAFLSPAYWSAAPYHAALLAMGLLVGRRLEDPSRRQVLGLLGAGAGVLALMALWQVVVGGQFRAVAFLETPATLASLLNFALLPVVVGLAYGERPARWVLPGVLLTAGLAATFSRGGWLGLSAGLFAAAYFARGQGFPLRPPRALAVAGVLAAGWLVVHAAPVVRKAIGAAIGLSHELLGEKAQESSVARLELFDLAWQTAQGHLAGGIGYRGFHHVLEGNRDRVPSFADGFTSDFVHNDYLQVLLELGLPGLAALAAMTILPFVLSLRRLPIAANDRLVAVAMLAAIASMSMHAVADFPFYVSICLLVFGLAMGVLDRCAHLESAPRAAPSPIRQRFLRIGATTLAAVVLVPPVVAEVVADRAHRAWQEADTQAAAYWYEVARRVEPRDWRFHLYAGHFWYFQAAQAGKPAAARLADQAFVAGIAANPREVRNLLGRIALHRDFPGLLDAPADAETIRRWVAQAAAMAPRHGGVRMELARIGAGRTP
jgi:O-antigen ligase